MAMRRYTAEQLEEARAYLRKRIEGEVSMEKDVHDLLGSFAERLVDMLLRGASQEEIDALVEDLTTMLLDDCQTLAVDEHTDKRNLILPYIMREWKGDTLEGRLRRRVNTFVEECVAVYAAGILLGKTRNVIVTSIRSNMKEPWNNPVLVEAREKVKSGDMVLLGKMDDIGIDNPAFFEERHYGRGVPVSSMIDLQRMTRFAVGEGWMYYGFLDAREKGAVGYFVERGSNIPCDICDSHVGVFYYITDDENRPQFHLSCRCVVVYVYNERL